MVLVGFRYSPRVYVLEAITNQFTMQHINQFRRSLEETLKDIYYLYSRQKCGTWMWDVKTERGGGGVGGVVLIATSFSRSRVVRYMVG